MRTRQLSNLIAKLLIFSTETSVFAIVMKRASQKLSIFSLHKAMEGNGNEPKSRRNVDDALAYLRTVKDKFRNDPAKYDTFLTLLLDLKAQRIDRDGCIKEVEELFNGDQDLISGFDKFLPKGLEIGEGDGVVVE